VRGSAGSGERLVYYHGHLDVVPAQSPSQFEPKRRDGKIVGRGTADMKGGLVSMLYGAAAAVVLSTVVALTRVAVRHVGVGSRFT
jgi:succinyl-diaminopimelate desuccinylase